MFRRRWARPLSLLLFVVYSITNCFCAYAAETQFWSERQRASRQNDQRTNAAQLARLGASIPIAAPLLSLQNSAVLSTRYTASLSPSEQKRLSPVFRALPHAAGSVRRVLVPTRSNGRVVVHIQDVHRNLEAQRNIARVVSSLGSAQQVGVVGLEGAFGPMDFSWFHRYAHPDAVRAVADYLLREKRISGSVFSAMQENPSLAFVGVDDKPAYEANVAAVRRASRASESQKQKLIGEQRALSAAKSRVFSADLMKFDNAVTRYRQKDVSWGSYVRDLAAASNEIPNSVRDVLEVLNLEKSIDFTRVETERSRLLAQLASKLSTEEQKQLLELNVAYHIGAIGYGAFYEEIQRLCRQHSVPLDRAPEFKTYIRYALLSDGLDLDRTMRDIAATEKRLYEQLAQTKQERELVSESRNLFLAGKLLDFGLSKSEWDEYKQSSDPRLTELSAFADFYRQAEIRDVAMAQNLLAASSLNSVLVTGGFHSAGIDERLRAGGCTVISFVPKITKLDNASDTAYLGVFTQEKTPLDKLFAGEKLFLAEKQFQNPRFIQTLCEMAFEGLKKRGQAIVRILNAQRSVTIVVSPEGRLETQTAGITQRTTRRTLLQLFVGFLLPKVSSSVPENTTVAAPVEAALAVVENNLFKTLLSPEAQAYLLRCTQLLGVDVDGLWAGRYNSVKDKSYLYEKASNPELAVFVREFIFRIRNTRLWHMFYNAVCSSSPYCTRLAAEFLMFTGLCMSESARTLILKFREDPDGLIREFIEVLNKKNAPEEEPQWWQDDYPWVRYFWDDFKNKISFIERTLYYESRSGAQLLFFSQSRAPLWSYGTLKAAQKKKNDRLLEDAWDKKIIQVRADEYQSDWAWAQLLNAQQNYDVDAVQTEKEFDVSEHLLLLIKQYERLVNQISSEAQLALTVRQKSPLSNTPRFQEDVTRLWVRQIFDATYEIFQFSQACGVRVPESVVDNLLPLYGIAWGVADGTPSPDSVESVLAHLSNPHHFLQPMRSLKARIHLKSKVTSVVHFSVFPPLVFLSANTGTYSVWGGLFFILFGSAVWGMLHFAQGASRGIYPSQLEQKYQRAKLSWGKFKGGEKDTELFYFLLWKFGPEGVQRYIAAQRAPKKTGNSRYAKTRPLSLWLNTFKDKSRTFSSAMLGEKFGLSKKTVNRVLREQGFATARPGRPLLKGTIKLRKFLAENPDAAYKITTQELAQKFKLDPGNVSRELQRFLRNRKSIGASGIFYEAVKKLSNVSFLTGFMPQTSWLAWTAAIESLIVIPDLVLLILNHDTTAPPAALLFGLSPFLLYTLIAVHLIVFAVVFAAHYYSGVMEMQLDATFRSQKRDFKRSMVATFIAHLPFVPVFGVLFFQSILTRSFGAPIFLILLGSSVVLGAMLHVMWDLTAVYLTKITGVDDVYDAFAARTHVSRADFDRFLRRLFPNGMDAEDLLSLYASRDRLTNPHSRFFRDEKEWAQFYLVLRRLVAYQLAEGDFRIHVRSVSASMGAEPYSAAIQIEALLQEAYTNLPEAQRNAESYESWRSKWSVRVDGFDVSLPELWEMTQGIYSALSAIHVANYLALFPIIKYGEVMSSDIRSSRVADALKQIVHPRYADLESERYSDIDSADYNVTISRYTLMHLTSRRAHELIAAFAHKGRSGKPHIFFFSDNEESVIVWFDGKGGVEMDADPRVAAKWEPVLRHAIPSLPVINRTAFLSDYNALKEELGISTEGRVTFRSFMEGRVPSVLIGVLLATLLSLGTPFSSSFASYSLTIVGWMIVALMIPLVLWYQWQFVLDHDNTVSPLKQIAVRSFAVVLFNFFAILPFLLMLSIHPFHVWLFNFPWWGSLFVLFMLAFVGIGVALLIHWVWNDKTAPMYWMSLELKDVFDLLQNEYPNLVPFFTYDNIPRGLLRVYPRIIRKNSSGSLVYRPDDKGSGVIYKVFRRDIQSVVREAHFLFQMGQAEVKQVLKLHAIGVDREKGVYLKLEGPIKAHSLRSWHSDKYTKRQLITFFCELIEILTQVHYLGILHMDLKPRNILVAVDGSRNPHPWVLDFDLAHYGAGIKSARGTRGWRAPEVHLTAASDVYSLGLILRLYLIERISDMEAAQSLVSLVKEMTADLPHTRPVMPYVLSEVSKLEAQLRKKSNPSLGASGLIFTLVKKLAQQPLFKPYTPQKSWLAWTAAIESLIVIPDLVLLTLNHDTTAPPAALLFGLPSFLFYTLIAVHLIVFGLVFAAHYYSGVMQPNADGTFEPVTRDFWLSLKATWVAHLSFVGVALVMILGLHSPGANAVFAMWIVALLVGVLSHVVFDLISAQSQIRSDANDIRRVLFLLPFGGKMVSAGGAAAKPSTVAPLVSTLLSPRATQICKIFGEAFIFRKSIGVNPGSSVSVNEKTTLEELLELIKNDPSVLERHTVLEEVVAALERSTSSSSRAVLVKARREDNALLSQQHLEERTYQWLQRKMKKWFFRPIDNIDILIADIEFPYGSESIFDQSAHQVVLSSQGRIPLVHLEMIKQCMRRGLRSCILSHLQNGDWADGNEKAVQWVTLMKKGGRMPDGTVHRDMRAVYDYADKLYRQFLMYAKQVPGEERSDVEEVSSDKPRAQISKTRRAMSLLSRRGKVLDENSDRMLPSFGLDAPFLTRFDQHVLGRPQGNGFRPGDPMYAGGASSGDLEDPKENGSIKTSSELLPLSLEEIAKLLSLEIRFGCLLSIEGSHIYNAPSFFDGLEKISLTDILRTQFGTPFKIIGVDLGSGQRDGWFKQQVSAILRGSADVFILNETEDFISGLLSNERYAQHMPFPHSFVSMNAPFPPDHSKYMTVADRLVADDGIIYVAPDGMIGRVDFVQRLLSLGFTVIWGPQLDPGPNLSKYDSARAGGVVLASRRFSPAALSLAREKKWPIFKLNSDTERLKAFWGTQDYGAYARRYSLDEFARELHMDIPDLLAAFAKLMHVGFLEISEGRWLTAKDKHLEVKVVELTPAQSQLLQPDLPGSGPQALGASGLVFRWVEKLSTQPRLSSLMPEKSWLAWTAAIESLIVIPDLILLTLNHFTTAPPATLLLGVTPAIFYALVVWHAIVLGVVFFIHYYSGVMQPLWDGSLQSKNRQWGLSLKATAVAHLTFLPLVEIWLFQLITIGAPVQMLFFVGLVVAFLAGTLLHVLWDLNAATRAIRQFMMQKPSSSPSYGWGEHVAALFSELTHPGHFGWGAPQPKILWRRWTSPFPERTLPGHRPLVVELGSGYGEVLGEAATQHPENNYVLIEPWTLYRRHLRKVAESPNVRVELHDPAVAVQNLEDLSVDELLINFPNPNGVVRQTTIDLARQLSRTKLKAGGRIIVVSENPEYLTAFAGQFLDHERMAYRLYDMPILRRFEALTGLPVSRSIFYRTLRYEGRHPEALIVTKKDHPKPVAIATVVVGNSAEAMVSANAREGFRQSEWEGALEHRSSEVYAKVIDIVEKSGRTQNFMVIVSQLGVFLFEKSKEDIAAFLKMVLTPVFSSYPVDRKMTLLDKTLKSGWKRTLPAVTYFFRDSHEWLSKWNELLQELVQEKAANDDYELTLRSVCSSIGAEPYSIAILVYIQLQLLHAKLSTTDKTLEPFDRWINKWTVQIDAFDYSLMNLLLTSMGIYLGEIQSRFETRGIKLEDFADVRDGFAFMHDILKKWIVPIYVDLRDPDQLFVLARRSYDATVSCGTLNYLLTEDNRNLVYDRLLGSRTIRNTHLWLLRERFDLSHLIFADKSHLTVPEAIGENTVAAHAILLGVLEKEEFPPVLATLMRRVYLLGHDVTPIIDAFDDATNSWTYAVRNWLVGRTAPRGHELNLHVDDATGTSQLSNPSAKDDANVLRPLFGSMLLFADVPGHMLTGTSRIYYFSARTFLLIGMVLVFVFRKQIFMEKPKTSVRPVRRRIPRSSIMNIRALKATLSSA